MAMKEVEKKAAFLIYYLRDNLSHNASLSGFKQGVAFASLRSMAVFRVGRAK